MNIIELAGLNPNSPAPRNVVSESDRQIARIPDHADGRRLGRHWWQADRGFLRAHPDTGRAVWSDRLTPGARLVATAAAWPTRDEVFTSTPATGSKKGGSFTVAGAVRMHSEGNILAADANTVYLAMRPTAGAAALVRVFGPQNVLPGDAPRDDALAFGLFDGNPRILSDDGAASMLIAPASDYRGQNVVLRIAKSTTYGASIAINGVEVARDASRTAALIDRTFALFGMGNAPVTTQTYGSVRHLMIFAGADFSADPYFAAADAVVTARLKADIGIAA